MQNRQEQINLLTEQLLKLIASDEQANSPYVDSQYSNRSGYPKSINETLEDFKRLNIDIDVVRKIMKRADELKGRTDLYTTKESIYEVLDKLIK